MRLDAVQVARDPLWMIFWGALLCLIDLQLERYGVEFTGSPPTPVRGTGFRFDFLNDAVGMALIAIGLLRLRAIAVSARTWRMLREIEEFAVVPASASGAPLRHQHPPRGA